MGRNEVRSEGRRPKTGLARAVFLDRDGVINRALVRGGKPYAPADLSEDCMTGTRVLVVALAAVSIGGCAVGQKFSYRDSRVNVGSIGAAGSAAVAVLDRAIVTECARG